MLFINMLKIKKNIGLVISILLFIPAQLFAISFKKAVLIIDKHPSTRAISYQSKSLGHLASFMGSTGDPVFKVSAKNFPLKSLRRDKVPMTALELSFAKKIPLSTKYLNKKSAFLSKAKAKQLEAKNNKQKLLKKLWFFIITNRQIKKEKIIIKKNILWIKNILRVSQKLYSNGKLSQTALLDIQIRKSELETQLSNNQFSYKKNINNLNYLIGGKNKDILNVPWQLLKANLIKTKLKDYKQAALKNLVLEKKYYLTAQKLNYIPDLNLSVSLSKRHLKYPEGDLVSLSLSFPLPFSASKYAKHGQALKEKYKAINYLSDYVKQKNNKSLNIKNNIDKIKVELSILNKKAIRFAQSYQSIVSKSYALGGATYIELLQSELKLQKLNLKKINLEEKKDKNIVSLKYLLGEKLHE